MKKKLKGVALVEILLAFLLAGILFSQFFSLVHQKNQIVRQTSLRLKALQAIESQMEELRTLPFDLFFQAHQKTFSVPQLPLKKKSSQPAGLILIESIHENLWRVEVKVQWYPDPQGTAFHTSLVTWVGKGGLFHAN
jgi:hypothetical protein